MTKKASNSINRRRKKGVRPLKKLINIHTEKINDDKNLSITAHRSQFLEDLKKEIYLPSFQIDSWSGTALDLLLLTEKITPKMHRAALGYTYFYSKNINHAPMRVGQQWGEDLITFAKPKYHYMTRQYVNVTVEDENREFEELWRLLNTELQRGHIKSYLDKIGPENNLSTIKSLLRSEPALRKLREGLEKMADRIEDLRQVALKNQQPPSPILQEE